MLEETIAQKMLERFTGVTSYNINIMNEKGIIIASQDKARIGTFHETAYNMIVKQQNIVEVQRSDQFLGTRSGVNLSIVNRSRVVGIVGITGEPEEVRPLAMMLKTSVEVMLEYEFQQEEIAARRSQKEHFFSQLLYQDEPSKAELEQQAVALGYDPQLIRIPVLITTANAAEESEISDLCKNRAAHTKQDILLQTADGQILIFLHLESGLPACSEYRIRVADYLETVVQYVQQKDLSCKFYIGSLQSSLTMYRTAYHHCTWLKQYAPAEGYGTFFYDHVRDYLNHCVPVTELRDIFETYTACLDSDFWADYAKIIGSMTQTNNNMVRSSQKLHMHKNTLVYHYNKIREQLNLNPMTNAQDNHFASCLCLYLECGR